MNVTTTLKTHGDDGGGPSVSGPSSVSVNEVIRKFDSLSKIISIPETKRSQNLKLVMSEHVIGVLCFVFVFFSSHPFTH